MFWTYREIIIVISDVEVGMRWGENNKDEMTEVCIVAEHSEHK